MLVTLVFALAAAPAAQAAGRFCISADTFFFGNVALGSVVSQRASVVNCGDAPWSFTDVSVHPATGAGFSVTFACRTGLTLGPGQGCDVNAALAPRSPGETSGGVWLRNTTATPNQLLTFYGRGVDASAGSAALAFVPASVDFGTVPIGTEEGPFAVSLRNAGPGSLTPSAIVLNGPAVSDFRGDAGSCAVGVRVAPGASCRVNLYFRPQAGGVRQANLVIDAPELASLAILQIEGTGATVAADAVAVVEFFNAAMEHYFVTAVAAEAAVIDRGEVGPGWARTGLGFRAWPLEGSHPTTAVPVCRFFGTPGLGPDSHFFTADPGECTAVRNDRFWFYEGVALRTIVPTNGGCPPGTDAVLRFFRPGTDVKAMRHRYLLAGVEAQRMRDDARWVEEGPVFCSPR